MNHITVKVFFTLMPCGGGICTKTIQIMIGIAKQGFLTTSAREDMVGSREHYFSYEAAST
jgi:hypothetical protein